MERLKDIWAVSNTSANWEFSEELQTKSEVDGQIILGRVRGQFFVPDGSSQNQRFYPKDLWESTLANESVKSRLDGRKMYGMIGHEDKPITEEDLRQGLVSHIVTKLWIDESGKGMGEALILGTNAGKNLFIYLKAGSKLMTSSRASGKLESGPRRNGLPVVDKNSYLLETFDFVLVPGFKEVNPMLVENKNKPMETNIDINKMIEQLTASRDSLQKSLTEQLDVNRQCAANGAALTAKLADAEAKTKALEDNVSALIGDPAKLQESFKTLGIDSKSFVSFLEKLDTDTVKLFNEGTLTPKDIAGYRALGTQKEISEAVASAKTLLESYSKLGKVEDLKKQQALLNEYKEIGTPKEINESIDKASEILSKYAEIGSPEEVSEAVKEAQEMIESFVVKTKAREMDEKVQKASKKYGVTIEVAKDLFESMPAAKAEKVLEGMTGKKTTKSAITENKQSKDVGARLSESLGTENKALRFFQSISPKAE